MTKRFPVLLASLLAVSSVSAPLQVLAQEAQPSDRIAAVVDEDVILQSELQRAIANIKAQYAGRENQLPPEDVLSRQVLERLVLVKLQVARAQGSGIRVSDQELNQAMNAIAQQNGSDLDALRQRLAHDGIDFNDFRASVRDEITVQRLRQSFAQSRISVSEGEVDAALKQQATVGNQYHLAHILIALPDGANADQIATGQKKADGVKALLDKGELDFNAAAVRYSDSPNALEGGDLGWRIAFTSGLVLTPLLWRTFSALPAMNIEADYALLLIAGFLVGLSTRYSSGCTSGHGVCGLARLSPRSIVATVTFMSVGIVTVFVVRHLLGE